MDIRIDEHIIRVVVIHLNGRIDAFSVSELRPRLQTLTHDGAKYFVVDLADVDFMDSAGMAVLVSLLKNARAADGDVCLITPHSPGAQRILSLTKFDRVFAMKANVDDALQHFLGN
jgi:anti-anti-sigma factor